MILKLYGGARNKGFLMEKCYSCCVSMLKRKKTFLTTGEGSLIREKKRKKQIMTANFQCF